MNKYQYITKTPNECPSSITINITTCSGNSTPYSESYIVPEQTTQETETIERIAEEVAAEFHSTVSSQLTS